MGFIESLINKVKEAETNSRCLFYQGVGLIELSIGKKLTVFSVADQGGLCPLKTKLLAPKEFA